MNQPAPVDGEAAAERAIQAEKVERCPHCGGVCSWGLEHDWWTLDCNECGKLVRRSAGFWAP